MFESLISYDFKVYKQDLLNIGFSYFEIDKMINENLIKEVDKNTLKVLKVRELKILCLKRILEFDRTILTQEELDYLGIEPIDILRITAYNIGETLGTDKIKIFGNIDELFNTVDSIDVNLYLELFSKAKKNCDYALAVESFNKYIELCNKLNINGDYYYRFTNFNDEIQSIYLGKKKQREYERSGRNYLFKLLAEDYEGALACAYKCYNILGTSNDCVRLAKTYAILKDYATAINFYELAKEKEPFNPKVYKNLGITYSVMGLKENAKIEFEKYAFFDKNTNYEPFYQLFVLALDSDIKKTIEIFSSAVNFLSKKQLEQFKEACIIAAKCHLSNDLKAGNYVSIKNQEILNLINLITKEIKFGIDDYEEVIREKEQNFEFENVLQNLLMEDENNIVYPSRVDDYISNLDINDEERNLMLLKASLVLARNNYIDRSKAYIIKVEKTKNKSKRLVRELNNTRKELKVVMSK